MRISRLLCLTLSVLATLGCIAQAIAAQPEIAAFRLMDRSAYVTLHSRYDKNRTERGSADSSTDSELVFQQEFGVDVQSYIYHPNFLVMDLSGGLLFDQHRNTLNDQSASDRSGAWNLGARLNFLRRKPYPFTLFFERSNPLASAGLAGSFTRENTKFGVSASALQPLLPVRLQLDIQRNMSVGQGFAQVVDETVDSLALTASKSFAMGVHMRLSYEATRTASASGATSLAIVPTQRTDHHLNLYSSYNFGADQQFQLTNISHYRVFEKPNRTDFRYTPNLRWKHSERLDSFYNLRLVRSTQDSGDRSEQAARAGLTLKLSKELSVSADVHGEITKTASRFESHEGGANVRVNYQRPIRFGELRMSHSLSYERNSQQATADSSNVLGEQLSLPATAQVTLARERVIASSVQVSNLARTQVFVEGIDYQLVVVGSRTKLQRIPAGAIAAAENVLVDYQFELQGTFSYEQLTNSHNIGVTLARYYELFARYQGVNQSIRSGTPTSQLNPITVFEVGARADVPVMPRVTVGAEILYTRQDEKISPFDRLDLNASVQLKLPRHTQLNVSARHVATKHDASAEDFDVLGLTANLFTRPFFRLNLSTSLDYERERGASGPRAITTAKMRAGWGIRQLRLNGEAGYLRERLRGFRRDDLYMRLTARRNFR